MDRNFKPGDLVRHFKWETCTDEQKRNCVYIYEFLGYAQHTETKEDLVIYRALYGDKRVFARPKEMFYSEVDHEKYPDIKQKYRLEKIPSCVQITFVPGGKDYESRVPAYLLEMEQISGDETN